MKKYIMLLICIFLLSVTTYTLAAGKISVDQENFHVVSGYWTYGYAYAKVSNVGDKPVTVNAGVLEIYDEEGDALTSTDYLSANAKYLAPGEYTYVEMHSEIKEGTADDYMMTLTGKADNSKYTLRLPVETSLELNVTSGWWTYNYMYATITNNTDAPLFGIEVVLALLDAEGNILYLDDDSLYSSRALMPGSSILIRLDIPSNQMDYFAEKNLVPVSVDAIAYVIVDAD